MAGKEYHSIPIVNRVDFSAIIYHPLPANIQSANHQVDNINNNAYAYIENRPDTMNKYQISTWTTATYFIASLTYSTYGELNSILNFGPYQYVVTIPESPVATSTIVFITKSDLIISMTLTLNARVCADRSSSQLEFIGTKAYFKIFNYAADVHDDALTKFVIEVMEKQAMDEAGEL